LIAAVMAVLLSRLGRAACPSEIAVIGPPFERTSCYGLYISKFNEQWRRKTPAGTIVLDEAENQSFLGFKFGAQINLEKGALAGIGH
jgi:hypothetical protein